MANEGAGSPHAESIETVAAALRSSPREGISPEESQKRLEEQGPNSITSTKPRGILRLVADQLREVMVLLLLASATISFFLKEHMDGAVILAIVALNAALGVWQELKARKAMASLQQLAVPKVRVRRGGSVREISSTEVVPGDVMLLETGNIVPADGRILEAANLKVQEAALTGEAMPLEKTTTPVAPDATLGDRISMLFMGTTVTYGRGEALVTATGMRTELGKIATMVQSVEDDATPLQKRLARLGKGLALGALALVVLVAAISLVRDVPPRETFLTAVSMAVAAIPEGLPAIVAIALALGAKAMYEKKSLVRHLPAVETLGSVTYICSDKTGTLTQNRMTVVELALSRASLRWEDESPPSPAPPAARLLLLAGALCNDAQILEDGEKPAITGDPTEGALLTAAAKAGIHKSLIEKQLPRVEEIPFDSERKRMTTVHRLTSEGREAFKEELGLVSLSPEFQLVAVKGSTDGLLPLCTRALVENAIGPLAPELREEILRRNDSMAKQGIRVLGIAVRVAPPENEEWEKDLVFLGMVGMVDPVRHEAKLAIAECRAAGITPVMITGDHPATALAIGEQLGLGREHAMTGADLEKTSDEDLRKSVLGINLYARVAPEHKMRIIAALQHKGQCVAMTGDGVNDAPALKAADIGIAMGITGTDVSKEAADMILVDDNFATIVEAVREGRRIFDNIARFVRYILAGNLAEILVMLAAPLVGLPLPLVPVQILWVNLVTDGLPAVALAYEPPEPDIMRRPPRSPQAGLFERGDLGHILVVAIATTILCLALGRQGRDVTLTRSLIFTTLTFCQMAFALSVRSRAQSVFRVSLASNVPLVGAVLLTILLQLAIIYVPWLQPLFRTEALSARELAMSVGAAILLLLVAEGEKWLRGRKSQTPLDAPHSDR